MKGETPLDPYKIAIYNFFIRLIVLPLKIWKIKKNFTNRQWIFKKVIVEREARVS